MRSLMLAITGLALCLSLSQEASAGPFGRRGGGCANGQCGGSSSQYSYSSQWQTNNAPAAPVLSEAGPSLSTCFLPANAPLDSAPATTAAMATDGLIAAGKVFPGARVCESAPQAYLMQLAQSHADYMCRTRTQGHQNFQTRFNYVARAGLGTATEICAESWSWQYNDTPLSLGRDAFRSWSTSPGHWAVASTRHRYFGAGMARGSNGIWYSCIIVAD